MVIFLTGILECQSYAMEKSNYDGLAVLINRVASNCSFYQKQKTAFFKAV